MPTRTGQLRRLWSLNGLGPEVKLFVLALDRTGGDVEAAARLAELKHGQGRLFESMLLSMGLATRAHDDGPLELMPERVAA